MSQPTYSVRLHQGDFLDPPLLTTISDDTLISCSRARCRSSAIEDALLSCSLPSVLVLPKRLLLLLLLLVLDVLVFVTVVVIILLEDSNVASEDKDETEVPRIDPVEPRDIVVLKDPVESVCSCVLTGSKENEGAGTEDMEIDSGDLISKDA